MRAPRAARGACLSVGCCLCSPRAAQVASKQDELTQAWLEMDLAMKQQIKVAVRGSHLLRGAPRLSRAAGASSRARQPVMRACARRRGTATGCHHGVARARRLSPRACVRGLPSAARGRAARASASAARGAHACAACPFCRPLLPRARVTATGASPPLPASATKKAQPPCEALPPCAGHFRAHCAARQCTASTRTRMPARSARARAPARAARAHGTCTARNVTQRLSAVAAGDRTPWGRARDVCPTATSRQRHGNVTPCMQRHVMRACALPAPRRARSRARR